MKNPTFPISIKQMLLASALVLPLLGSVSAGSALAQNFDVTTLQSSASATGGAGESLGDSGNVGRTSYKTGEAPHSAGLSGNTTSVTTKQLGSGLTNHLTLPYAGTAGLAGVFGMGTQVAAPQRFTTVLDDPINLPGLSIDPSTGGVTTRTGNTVTSVGGLGSGNVNGSINLGGGTNLNLGGIGTGLLNGGFSGF